MPQFQWKSGSGKRGGERGFRLESISQENNRWAQEMLEEKSPQDGHLPRFVWDLALLIGRFRMAVKGRFQENVDEAYSRIQAQQEKLQKVFCEEGVAGGKEKLLAVTRYVQLIEQQRGQGGLQKFLEFLEAGLSSNV